MNGRPILFSFLFSISFLQNFSPIKLNFVLIINNSYIGFKFNNRRDILNGFFRIIQVKFLLIYLNFKSLSKKSIILLFFPPLSLSLAKMQTFKKYS